MLHVIVQQHGFAFVPDDGRPNRLVRFMSEAKFPEGAVSLYDFERNLLLVDRKRYDTLSYEQQQQVLRTQEKMLFTDDLPTE